MINPSPTFVTTNAYKLMCIPAFGGMTALRRIRIE
jgi:hypothetical protein